MEKKLELIWKKLDGDITREEAKVFDSLYKSDEGFKQLYLEQSRLNNTLKNIPLQKAPDSILDNVMKAVSAGSVLRSKYISFSGLKTIIALFGSFMLIACVWYFASNGINLESSGHTMISGFFDNLNSKLTLPESLKTYLPYSMVLIAGLGLLWMDSFLKSKRLSYTSIF